MFQSHNEEDIISEGEGSPRDHEDQDSCDDMRRHSMMNDHVDVLAKLKMQVRDIKVGVSFKLYVLLEKADNTFFKLYSKLFVHVIITTRCIDT